MNITLGTSHNASAYTHENGDRQEHGCLRRERYRICTNVQQLQSVRTVVLIDW